MPLFRVLVLGENFVVDTEAGIKKMGFTTHRYVVAESFEDARFAALEAMEQELTDRALNDPEDPPELRVGELQVVAAAGVSDTGIDWFEKDEAATA